MKPNLKITLLSVTAISLTGGIVFAATQQNPASLAYVNAEDINVENAIVAKGGTVPSSADTCRRLGYGEGTPASIAYVNECDLELYEAIEAIPSGGSPFSVGDTLCGDTHPYTCPASNPEPWGIVIYADPNPTTSGYYGVAMSVEDVIQGYNGSGTGTPWANSALQSTLINANNYGIYGGINGTFKNYLGNATDGNTQIFCNFTGNDCTVPTTPGTTSAFNACAQYSNGPSLAGGWYLPSIAEATLMFTYAQNQPLPTATGVETFNSYYYWSSTEYSGSTNAASFSSGSRPNGNLGFGAGVGVPAQDALDFDFIDGGQAYDNKTGNTEGVRCAQALPI